MRIINFSQEDNTIGPGTDLVISLVAVLVMMLAINNVELQAYKLKEKAELNVLEKIKAYQLTIIKAVARHYQAAAQTKDSIRFTIPFRLSTNSISIENDGKRQHISFGAGILFEFGVDNLQYEGKKIIKEVGFILKGKLGYIKEIQIQGHADVVGNSDRNLVLASRRAISVYQFLQDEVAIDPIVHLMSATTYGKYKPVQRKDAEKYSDEKLNMHNSNELKRKNNRRIEIVLIYKDEV